MSPLRLLWWSALALAGLALVVMLLLVALRVRRARSDAENGRARRASARAITLLLSGEDASAELAACAATPWVLVETALEFLSLVRGVDHERLCAALRGMRLDPRSRRLRSTRTRQLSALEALAFFPGPATVATLTSVLATAQPALQAAALRSLILLDAAPPLPELLSRGRSGWSESRLFADVATTIARERPQEVREALALEGLAQPLRVVLLEALGAAGDYAALPLLSATLGDVEPTLRAAAVRALGALAHPSAAPLLQLAAADPVWQVRAEAMTAIGRSGLSALAPVVVQRLQDEAWWVRFRAGEAVALLGEPARAAPALQEAQA